MGIRLLNLGSGEDPQRQAQGQIEQSQCVILEMTGRGWDLGLDQLQGGRDPQQDPEEAVQSSGVALSRHL